MLCRQIIAVCSETHTEYINKLRGQNVEVLNFKDGNTPDFKIEFYVFHLEVLIKQYRD